MPSKSSRNTNGRNNQHAYQSYTARNGGRTNDHHGPPQQYSQSSAYQADSSEDDMYRQQENRVLGVPVWQDSSSFENESYLHQTGGSGYGYPPPPPPSQYQSAPQYGLSREEQRDHMRRIRDSNVGMAPVPASTEEAFRIILAGVTAEAERRYLGAVNDFLAGGEMLATVAEREPDPHVSSLLNHKALQSLTWSKALHDWVCVSLIQHIQI
jgi:hypothetical protein